MAIQTTINTHPAFVAGDEKKMQLLKDTFFKGSSNDEFMLFAHACERTGLDPFLKQIYPVKRWDSTLKKEIMTVQTGIDGYRLMAERTGCYSPGKEPTFNYNKEGKLISSTAYVKKLTKDGTWHEVSATAFYDEYCQRTKEGNPTSMWSKMPHSQLAKCAESLALRKAFPAELSGMYTKEEMEQSEIIEARIQKVESISRSQAEELLDLITQCDAEYRIKFHKGLVQNNINQIENLPIALYEKTKIALLKKVEESKGKEIEEQWIEDEEEEEESV